MFTCGDCSICKDILVDREGLEAMNKGVNTHFNLPYITLNIRPYTTIQIYQSTTIQLYLVTLLYMLDILGNQSPS
jgi:hypothetical protein